MTEIAKLTIDDLTIRIVTVETEDEAVAQYEGDGEWVVVWAESMIAEASKHSRLRRIGWMIGVSVGLVEQEM